MKKAYIIPAARVITLCDEHELMNTGSLQSLSIDDDDANAVNGVNGVYSNKRNSIWGE